MSLLPRPLPCETVKQLVPPLPGFGYFAHADQFPFEPRARIYSPVNAWWLADASFLVYGTSGFIEDALSRSPLPQQGFELQWLGSADDNRGMMLVNDQTIIVVFRGTRLQTHSLLDVAEIVLVHENDLWTDSRFVPAVCRAGGRVHHGFLDAYSEISALLDAAVQQKRRDQTVWLTGHSLGGALATVASAHFDNALIQGIYTYGCPRVGDEAFVSVLPANSHFRFVHRKDWVPTVPPELLGYLHGGSLCPLSGSGHRRLWNDMTTGVDQFASAMRNMARQLKLDVGELPFQISGLADHAAIYYATLLWNLLLETSESAN